MSRQWKDRVVLVAGATGALGSTVAHHFARTEARLALTSRSMGDLETLGDAIGLSGDRVLVQPADATEPQDVDALVSTVVDRFGRLDVLLNAVGGWGGGKAVGETSVEAWDQMLDLNLRSAFLLSRAVLPHMMERGWGRIVHVGSKTAVQPRAKQVGYVVAKMGVVALTEAIATEVKGSGVTANVILPSIIDTEENRSAMSSMDPEKWVSPEQIAATMWFLCTEAGAAINGARVPIYGAL